MQEYIISLDVFKRISLTESELSCTVPVMDARFNIMHKPRFVAHSHRASMRESGFFRAMIPF